MTRIPDDHSALDGLTLRPELALDDGRLDLILRRADATVVTAAALGVRTAGRDLTSVRSVGDPVATTVADRYAMTTGKSRERSYEHTELRWPVAATEGDFVLVVRVAPDGIAYRYELPGEEGDEVTVREELGSWTLPADGPTWHQTRLAVNYEGEYAEATVREDPTAEFGYPALFEVGDSYLLITEADLDGRYAGTYLASDPDALSYRIRLFNGESVTSSAPLQTPWRVAIIGDLATVVESTLVDDLGQPSRIDDRSWIRPGRCAWSWLTDHASPRDPQRQRDFVELAARQGWEYVLFDEGWDEAWVPELIDYARERGVDSLLWFHSKMLWTPEQRQAWLPKIKDWGVRGVKVDFMDSDSQETLRWYDDILIEAADLQLMINFHGSTIPHGLARTWPHLMTMEGIRGEENGRDEARTLIVGYTRNVVGSMDFTPTVFSFDRSESSHGQQLGLAIAYESGWQHVSDSPESYATEPAAAALLREVPSVWDETRHLGGRPARDQVIARRDGERWFVAGLRSGEPGSLRVPLDFLGDGRWRVRLLTDDPEATTAPFLVETVAERSATDTLTVTTVRNGGFAAELMPIR